MEILTRIPSDRLDELSDHLEMELGGLFEDGDRVCIKLHMGERDNPNHVRPDVVQTVVDSLKMAGTEPFLFDSLTVYHGFRHNVKDHLETAAKHGFTPEAMGCPVVIGDNDSYTEVASAHMKFRVCKPLYEADGLVVLSHVKGHGCSGFGGAVKNLGMGALTAKTKSDIHKGGSPVLVGDCAGCEDCVGACPTENIKMEGGKFHMLSEADCMGCERCILGCPKQALKPKIALFDTLLAEGAKSSLDGKGKRIYFVNVLEKIARECDCWNRAVPIALEGAFGFVCGPRAVAVDKASLDIINKAAGRDLFKEVSKKDPMLHLNAAEWLGMGPLAYEMREIE